MFVPGLDAAQREFISPERGRMLRAKIDDTKVHAPSEYRAEGWALPPLSERFLMLQPTSAIQIPNGEDRRSHRGQDGQRNEPHRCSGHQWTRCFLDNDDNAVSVFSTRPPTS